MQRTTQAVILVAGEGKRLRPFTNSNPKCFASVNGKPLLENALEAFAAAGCNRIRIVIGHLAAVICQTITDRFAGMTIEYVYNSDYATTNSMYSLALGLEGLDAPTWVLEGDVFFEHAILNIPAPPELAWFVDSSSRHLDGAYVESDPQGRALSLKIVRDLRLLQPNQAKSIGMLKLTRKGVQQMQAWLSQGIATGLQNVYYDLIIGAHMTEGHVHTVDVAGRKWFEIDTNEDLKQAERLFA